MKPLPLPSPVNQSLTGALVLLMALPFNTPFMLLAQPSGPVIVVNQGSPSRSTVTNLSVTFPTNRVLAPGGFVLQPLPGARAVASSNLLLSVDALANRYDVTFPGLPAGSIPDGNYHAIAVSTPATNAAGPREGVLLPVHRYFGDQDGDRDVDFFDTWFFRETWGEGTTSARFDPQFDADGDGLVSTNDLAHFNSNYFTILSPQPAIFAHLVLDDGANPDDGVVDNLAVAGSVYLTNAAARFEAALEAPDSPPGTFTNVTADLTLDSTFIFNSNRLTEIHGRALTNGWYNLHFRLVETNDLVSAAFTLPFALGEQTICRFPDLSGWITNISSDPPPGGVLGTAASDNCAAVLTEGDSFSVQLEQTFSIPAGLGLFYLAYDAPSFDATATHSINDAFEVALVDAAGRPLTWTIQGSIGVTPAGSSQPQVLPASPDAFFNHTQTLDPVCAPGADIQSDGSGGFLVRADLRHLAANSPLRVILRLVNNDRDRATTIRVTDLGFRPVPPNLNFPEAVPPAFSSVTASAGGLISPTGQSGTSSSTTLGAIQTGVPTWPQSSGVEAASSGSTPDQPVLEGIVAGVFGNPIPVTATYTGVGSNYFTWGYSDTPVNSLRFAGEAFRVFPDSFFTVGTLDYFNGSVFGGGVNSIELWLTISVTNLHGQATATFKYPLTVIATTNTSDAWASADYVILPVDLPTNSFVLGGTEYRLQLVFGRSDTNGFTAITQFHVLEDASASAEVVGRLTEMRSLTPGPPTLAIQQPANQSVRQPGATSLSGYAVADRPELFPGIWATNRIVSVSVNGQAVEALDSAGNFFCSIEVRPGRNSFNVAATDAFDQTTSQSLTIYGQTGYQNLSNLQVLSASIQPEYRRTSFNDWTGVLYTDLSVRNVGANPIRPPLYVGITRISDPTVSLLGADGTSADGIPYYDFTAALTNSTLDTQHSTLPRTLAFHDTNHVQFTYELVVLGQLNQPPQFTSVPVLEAIVGKPYAYNATATDPDLDTVTLSSLIGPTNLILTPGVSNPGEGSAALTWTPSVTDVGVHDIRILANDGRGGTSEQHYLLSVIDPPGNRPPYFVSEPITMASAGLAYDYESDAADPDSDALLYTVAEGPSGMTIDPAAGLVHWGPTADQVGTHNVTLQVEDGRGGTNWQSYVVFVSPSAGNRPPVFISQPVETAAPERTYVYPVSAIDPEREPVSYELVSSPSGMHLDSSVNVVAWTPTDDEVGAHSVVIRARDRSGGAAEQSYVVTVTTGTLGQIRGTVWNDVNGDGTWQREPTTKEGVLPMWRLFLDQNNNTSLDAGELTTTADERGEFVFEPRQHNLWVRMVAAHTQPTGCEQLLPSQTTASTGHHTPRPGRRAVATGFEPPARVATGRHA